MKKALDVILKILKSDAVTVAMGLALAYGYIRWAVALIDYMTGVAR